MYCLHCNGFRKVGRQKLAREKADAVKDALQARDEVQERQAYALERIANMLSQIKRGLEHSYQKPFDVFIELEDEVEE